VLRGFRDECASRWDLGGLRERVIASQRRRHLVAASLAKGAHFSWDFQPARDASRQYVRNHLDLDDIEAAARFPRVS
jgi:choline-sulfatase